MKYLLIILCFTFSFKMMAQDGSPSSTKDWFAEEENLFCGCSYARSPQGTKNAVLYYSIKEKEDADGINHSKMFVDVVELSKLEGGVHELLFIDDEYPGGQTCTDVLLIRQDGHKVYCKSENGTQEWLILDFGLKTGDTFVNGVGERYLVKETTNSDDSSRKKLLLASENGTQEDTWEEGIGSLRWGFLPDYVVKTLTYFQDAEEPLFINLWAASAPYYFVEQSVNDDYFKLKPLDEIKDEEAETMTYEDLTFPLSLDYSFVGDSLWVQGYYPLSLYHSFIAARITGTYIDVSIHQVSITNNVSGMHVAKIDVKIPGFPAGTYEIGLNGNETQTVICSDANGTNIQNDNDKLFIGTFYDLQGRRLPQAPQKGVYIQNGKKVAIK